MRIGIQTWGSHGDIRPLLALAEKLQSSGHKVSLAITCIDSAEYNESISKTGVKIQSVASPVIQDKEDYAKIENIIFNESNPIKQLQTILTRLFEPAEAEMHQVAERLCIDNDLVIGHFFHYPLHIAAEKARCPYVSIMLVHSAIASTLQPPTGFPNLGKLGNRLTWWLIRSVLNKNIKPYADRLRVAHGLKPANDLMTDIWASHQMNLIAISPEICQRQNDWPDHYQVCGFFDMPNFSLEGELSGSLEEFLSQGDSPTFITFGSAMPSDTHAQKETLTLLFEAIQIANCRAIIQAPLWQECGIKSTQKVHFVNACPHSAVFPRCNIIIHHGGAGTTQAVTLAGKPSIVVAYIAEQEFWGRELERVGIAPAPLSRKKLSAEQLAKTIKDVFNSREIKEQARNIGVKMNKEDGVGMAVKLINKKFENRIR